MLEKLLCVWFLHPLCNLYQCVYNKFLFVFCFFHCRLQLALGHGARRLHVSAAYRAKASVSMSRFEPSTFVNYEKLQSNVDIVRKRSASSLICCSVCVYSRPHHWVVRHSRISMNVFLSISSVCLPFTKVFSVRVVASTKSSLSLCADGLELQCSSVVVVCVCET